MKLEIINENKFSFKNTWEYIKGAKVEVDWYENNIEQVKLPERAYCAYFALLNRLPTRDRCKKNRTKKRNQMPSMQK